MAQVAGRYLLSAAHQAVAEHGRFSLVLAGGRTPERLYQLLAAPPLAAQMPWKNTHVFQGDERGVPPEHPASNYRLAAASLLASGLIPAVNIHRMQGEAEDIAGAAVDYQRQIRDFFSLGADRQGFDLILLGMGNDGHIASLFPGSPLLAEENRLVAAETEPAGDPPLPRLTLTLPAINSATRILVMISGPDKQKIMSEIMTDRTAAAKKYPAALVAPRRELLWLVAP